MSRSDYVMELTLYEIKQTVIDKQRRELAWTFFDRHRTDLLVPSDERWESEMLAMLG